MSNNSQAGRICLIPDVKGVGGMVSFRDKLVRGLAERGIGVTYDINDRPYHAILVIGGTHDLWRLWRAKQASVRIVQRLDGMNWIHRRKPTGWRHYVRAEYGNFILALIRSRLADRIVYQSNFCQQWWETAHGKIAIPSGVVYNGVDLSRYTPNGNSNLPADHTRLLVVEGTIGSGYEVGLETAVQIGERLASSFNQRVEVMIVGRVADELQKKWQSNSRISLTFAGKVPAEKIPEIDRSAHILYAADLNPACPNSVIEALACGLPVAAFDTGALPEIVTDGSGQIVPYGGNPWRLESPDFDSLVKAINIILENQDTYHLAARQRAEKAFGLDRMVEGYLEALNL